MTVTFEQRLTTGTAERSQNEAPSFHIPTLEELERLAHPDNGNFIPPHECDTHEQICNNLCELREFQLTPISEKDMSPAARTRRRDLANEILVNACKLASETLPSSQGDILVQDYTEIEAKEVSAQRHSASLVEIELVLLSWGTVRDPDLAMASRTLLDEYARQLDARKVAESDPERRHFELLQATFNVTMERTKASGRKSDIFNNYHSLVELSSNSSSSSNPDFLRDSPRAYSESRAPLGKRILTKLGVLPVKERVPTELERAYVSTNFNEILEIYSRISPDAPYDGLALVTNLYRRLDPATDVETKQFVANLTADAAEKVLDYCQPANNNPAKDEPNIRAIFSVIDAIDITTTQSGKSFTDWPQGHRLVDGLDTLVDACIEQKFTLSTPENDPTNANPSMLEPVRQAIKEYRLDNGADTSLTDRIAEHTRQASELLSTQEAKRTRADDLKKYKEHITSLVAAIRAQVKEAA